VDAGRLFCLAGKPNLQSGRTTQLDRDDHRLDNVTEVGVAQSAECRVLLPQIFRHLADPHGDGLARR
jgi:hypothetical protein